MTTLYVLLTGRDETEYEAYGPFEILDDAVDKARALHLTTYCVLPLRLPNLTYHNGNHLRT